MSLSSAAGGAGAKEEIVGRPLKLPPLLTLNKDLFLSFVPPLSISGQARSQIKRILKASREGIGMNKPLILGPDAERERAREKCRDKSPVL